MRKLVIVLILATSLHSIYPKIEVGENNGINIEDGHIVITMPAEEYCELYNISKEPLY